MRILILLLLGLCSSAYGQLLNGTVVNGVLTNVYVSSLNTGLVSYWTLNETSGNRADSYGNNTLTDSGAVLASAGKIGKGTLMDGNDFLSKADDADFGFTTAFTFSCWIQRGTIGVNQTIVGKWTYQTDGGWIMASDSSSAPDLIVIIATSASDNGNGCAMLFADANQSASTWYHMVLVYDGTLSGNANRLKVYQNNVALTLTVAAGAVPSSLQNDGADFLLGKFGGSLTRYFDGIHDEAGLWNRALTAAEVTALYGAGVGKMCCPFAP